MNLIFACRFQSAPLRIVKSEFALISDLAVSILGRFTACNIQTKCFMLGTGLSLSLSLCNADNLSIIATTRENCWRKGTVDIWGAVMSY